MFQKKLYFILISSFLLIVACNDSKKNETTSDSPKADSLFTENNWYEFKYTIDKGTAEKEKWEEAIAKVIVERSEYHIYKGRTQLIVYWRAINTDKEPKLFGWANKPVMDEAGRIFAPYEGWESKLIQPLDETGLLRVAYDLPGAVNLNNLFWGLYQGDIKEGLKYKIKLSPKSK